MATYKSSKELEGHELLLGDEVIFPIKDIPYYVSQYKDSKEYGLRNKVIWTLWEESASLSELTLRVMNLFKEQEASLKDPNFKRFQ